MTHNERVLQLLSDGQPHSHHEGYALNVMLHSRAADLRRKGYDIRCWRDGDLYLYQLVSGPLESPSSAWSGDQGEGVSSGTQDLPLRDSPDDTAGVGESVPLHPNQLQLEGIAA